jgi:hypothetical protein
MKKTFLLPAFIILSVFKLNAQDIKAEFTDPSDAAITECDCKSTGDKAYSVKLWLPKSTFMYDQVTIHFNQANYTDYLPARTFSGKQLQAQSSDNGYVTIQLYPCGGYDKKDFTISVKVTGAMITSYKEELQNNAIVKTPIFGSPDAIGKTDAIPVHPDAGAVKKRMGKMWILSGVVCGGLLLLLLVNNKPK